MNIVQQIRQANGLAKIKLLKEFSQLSGLQKVKALKEFTATESSSVSDTKVRAETNQLLLALDKVKGLAFTDYEDFEKASEMISEAFDKTSNALPDRSEDVQRKHSEVNEYIRSKARKFVDSEVIRVLGSKDLQTMQNISEKLDSYIGVREYAWYEMATEALDMRIIDFETEPKEDNEDDVIDALETIKSVLENQNSTYDDYKQLEAAIGIVAENEESLDDNMLYHEVINLLEELTEDGTVSDGIYGGNLFDDVQEDSVNMKKTREFRTYQAWKRAVKELDTHAVFTGDKEIDSAFKKRAYDADWDGEVGHIVVWDIENGG